MNVQDAKTNLSRLLREVESGQEIVIARAGRPIARLVRADAGQRRWGRFEGRVTIAADAFAPAKADEVADWEDGELEP